MKRGPPRQIIPRVDQSHGITFEAFSALIRKQKLEKIEKTLQLELPCDGFRDCLVRILWRFYLNCLPEAHIRNSRAVLKNELTRSAQRAHALKASAELLWQSNEPAFHDVMRDLVGWPSWLSTQPMHPSGVALVALLSEFAKRATDLAATLPDDKGGPRRALAFDILSIGLSDCYRARLSECEGLAKERPEPSVRGPVYFSFAAAVTEALKNVSKNLPAADMNLPDSDEALRKRLLRLNRRRREGREPSARLPLGT